MMTGGIRRATVDVYVDDGEANICATHSRKPFFLFATGNNHGTDTQND